MKKKKRRKERKKKKQQCNNRIGLNESQCKNCSWQVQLPRALMPKGQTNELYAHGYNILIVCRRKMINVQEREREDEFIRKRHVYAHESR